MSVFLTVLLLVALILLILFCFIIYPAVIFVDKAKSRNTKGKAVWLILMFFLWPIPQLFYGVKFAKAARTRIVCLFCLIVILSTLLMTAILIPKLRHVELISMEGTIEQVKSVDMPGSLPGARETVIAALENLSSETKVGDVFQVEKFQVLRDLHRIIERMMADGSLTASEYQSWIEKYRTRALLDPDALEDFLREMR